MNTDGIFSSNEINVQNISELSRRQSVTEEQRICELAEIASEAADYALEMYNEGYGVYEILSLVADGFSQDKRSMHEEASCENMGILDSFLSFLDSGDKIVFSKLFSDSLLNRGIKLKEEDFLLSEIGNESFTYVKNPLADEAYDVFSQEFSDPRVKYSQSFQEAVRLVASGEVEYALLPLEERGGARIALIAELLFKEDLKINRITPVFGYEGLADVKYALVSRHFMIPEISEDDDRYLEVRLRKDASISLADIFLAAESMKVSIYRINTISFNTDDGASPYYSLVFSDDGADFSLLLVYLTLFSGAYSPVGIYKNLE